MRKEPDNRLKLWRSPTGTLAELNEAAKKNLHEMKPNLKVHQKDDRKLHRSLRPHKLKELDDCESANLAMCAPAYAVLTGRNLQRPS